MMSHNEIFLLEDNCKQVKYRLTTPLHINATKKYAHRLTRTQPGLGEQELYVILR